MRRPVRLLVALPLMCALASSGCLSAPGFVTSFVTLPAASIAALPERGDGVVVAVQDLRKGVSGYEVGSKRAAGWGSEGSRIDLKDREALGDHLARDLVMLLRGQGYRARDSREAAGQPAALILTAGIEQFKVLADLGTARVTGLAVLRLQAGRPDTRQLVWRDVVMAEVEKQGFQQLDADYQEIAEKLYRVVLRQLRDKLAAGLPLPAGG
ncbi:MAG TPA: hypothetical protein VFN71_10880 [Methylomirabilota bacterium]|nr:hypothetical protein [Methylomirabilota bacterium]